MSWRLDTRYILENPTLTASNVVHVSLVESTGSSDHGHWHHFDNNSSMRSNNHDSQAETYFLSLLEVVFLDIHSVCIQDRSMTAFSESTFSCLTIFFVSLSKRKRTWRHIELVFIGNEPTIWTSSTEICLLTKTCLTTISMNSLFGSSWCINQPVPYTTRSHCCLVIDYNHREIQVCSFTSLVNLCLIFLEYGNLTTEEAQQKELDQLNFSCIVSVDQRLEQSALQS